MACRLFDGVEQRLTLRGGGGADVEIHHVGRQAGGGYFEGGAGAGRAARQLISNDDARHDAGVFLVWQEPAEREGNNMQMQQVQVGKDGRLRHLLTLEGLSRDMIHKILDNASSFLNVSDRQIKKVPLLRGRSVFNLFFEDSTRTRTTFEIAATRLSADVVNLNISTSSTRRVSRCSTPSTTCRPWRPTSSWCGTARAVPRT